MLCRPQLIAYGHISYSRPAFGLNVSRQIAYFKIIVVNIMFKNLIILEELLKYCKNSKYCKKNLQKYFPVADVLKESRETYMLNPLLYNLRQLVFGK